MDYKKIYDICHSDGYMNEDEVGSYVHILEPINELKLEYKTVLDVGCSIGNGVKFFNNIDKHCCGLDVSEVAVELAKKRGLNVHQGSITNIEFKNDSFDMVTCTDVLEHLTDNDIAIDELIRVSNKYITLKIANIKETSDIWANKVGLDNLHVSVFDFDKWLNIFTRPDIKIIYKCFKKSAKFTLLILEKI